MIKMGKDSARNLRRLVAGVRMADGRPGPNASVEGKKAYNERFLGLVASKAEDNRKAWGRVVTGGRGTDGGKA